MRLALTKMRKAPLALQEDLEMEPEPELELELELELVLGPAWEEGGAEVVEYSPIRPYMRICQIFSYC